jgi:hypothetical protein
MSKVTRFSAETLKAMLATAAEADAIPADEAGMRELDREALLRLANREDLTPDAAVLLLRHPLTGKAEIEALYRNKDLHAQYEFRLAFIRHPKTLAAPAVQFLRTLFWRDQYDLSRDARAAPLVQRTAQTLLVERIPELALGEQITLARIAWPEMIPALMAVREEKVRTALLDNPRFTEGHVVHFLEDASLPASVVEQIARHHRWAFMHRVRALLIRDSRLPNQSALRLMKGMPESELQLAAKHPDTSQLRGMAAKRLARKK